MKQLKVKRRTNRSCSLILINLLFPFPYVPGLVPERPCKMATKPAAAAESGPRNRTRLQTPVWVGRVPATVLWSLSTRFLSGGRPAHTHHPGRTEHTDIYKSAVVEDRDWTFTFERTISNKQILNFTSSQRRATFYSNLAISVLISYISHTNRLISSVRWKNPVNCAFWDNLF